jgi:hypothetical protein
VFVALVAQLAERMSVILFTQLACPTAPNLCTLSHKRRDFWKKFFNIKCVFRLSLKLLSEMLLILRNVRRDTGLPCKLPVILFEF